MVSSFDEYLKLAAIDAHFFETYIKCAALATT